MYTPGTSPNGGSGCLGFNLQQMELLVVRRERGIVLSLYIQKHDIRLYREIHILK